MNKEEKEELINEIRYEISSVNDALSKLKGAADGTVFDLMVFMETKAALRLAGGYIAVMLDLESD